MSTSRYERLSTSNKEDGFTNEEEIELENETKIHETPSLPTLARRGSSKVMNMAIGSLALILLYLTLSIFLTFYQQWLLKDLKFPLAIVSYHLIIKLVMSASVRVVYKLITGRSRIHLDFRTSLKKMAPTGIASGIDIGFSNWGLELVQMSLYTMTKSTTIVFILFFAILLGLEKKSWSLVMIVVLIASGLFIFTYKSTQFDAFGFAFLLFASFTSGIRWSFAQLVMQKSKLGLHNPIDMIYHMQPWMILSILPFTIGFEGGKLVEVMNSLPDATYEEVVFLFTKISIAAFIAFFMEISEFLVLAHTSSLTLSIAGIFKDICQIVLAVEWKGEQLTLMNILGLILCLGGICCHVIHKYSTLTSPKHSSVLMDEEDTRPITRLNDNSSHTVTFRKVTGQDVPLLDSLTVSDSEDSTNADEPNASEVIFDVLKRRDPTVR